MIKKLAFLISYKLGLEKVTTVGYSHPQQGEVTASVTRYSWKYDVVNVEYYQFYGDGGSWRAYDIRRTDWLGGKDLRRKHNLRSRHA